tara:strand:- start:660 stop:1262 length:603 start_codon:yes stop_codon:yes gene_type:complete
MQALFDYIISTENRYNNTVDVDDKKLIVNTEITERDHIFVNRIGTVHSCPVATKTKINKGDKVILHHNVFRRWYDSHGQERNSASYIGEDKYVVADDQIYAYKKNGKWKCLPEYCFIKPLYKNSKWSLRADENLSGELVYLNEYLEQLGLSKGSIVGFTPNSEYEFNIDGQKLYRVLSNQITIDYGSKTKNSSSSGKSVN